MGARHRLVNLQPRGTHLQTGVLRRHFLSKMKRSTHWRSRHGFRTKAPPFRSPYRQKHQLQQQQRRQLLSPHNQTKVDNPIPRAAEVVEG
ncbi:unnamed protein product, partial [Ectocarpus sp. 12 AP-2014]